VPQPRENLAVDRDGRHTECAYYRRSQSGRHTERACYNESQGGTCGKNRP